MELSGKRLKWKLISFIIILMLACDAMAAKRRKLSPWSKLIADLMGDYDIMAPPILRAGGSVNVTIGLSINDLIDVDEVMQSIETSKWIEMFWHDYRLQWDPRAYGGIQVASLSHDKIWLPDIMLLNSINTVHESSSRMSYATVRYTGDIRFLHYTVDVTPCGIDLRNFPFDNQHCMLKLGTANVGRSIIDIHPLSKHVNIQTLDPRFNNEWLITKAMSKRSVKRYDCCANELFPDVTITINMTRRPKFYVLTLIAPSLLLCFVSVIGLFSPSSSTGERQERFSLGIATLLAMVIILMMITEKMPTAAENLPLLGISYAYLIIIVSIATIVTVFTMQVEARGYTGKRVPMLLRKLCFGIIGRLLLVDAYCGAREQKQQLSYLNRMVKKAAAKNRNYNSGGGGDDVDDSRGVSGSIDELRRHVARREWRAMSIVLDRIFLLIFVALLVYVSLSVAFPTLVPLPADNFSSFTFLKADDDVADDVNITEKIAFYDDNDTLWAR